MLKDAGNVIDRRQSRVAYATRTGSSDATAELFNQSHILGHNVPLSIHFYGLSAT